MPKVKVKNLEKVFGHNIKRARQMFKKKIPKNKILEKTGCAIGVYNASFEVYEGETLVIMGLSGSGKSTLIRCINRLYEPTGGSILVDNTDVRKLSKEELRNFRQKKFGMVFQNFALMPHKTILENTAFGLELQDIEEGKRKEKAEEALKLVQLEGWENVYPHHLSGGMQQRVGLARALAVDTDMLLMDEAFSALDPLIRAEMQEELLSLEERVKKTIIFITHDLDEALKVGDRIILMKDAEIVQTGTPEEILKNPATRYVERFVENVDMTKVLSVKDVMIKARMLTLRKHGPRTALHMMKKYGVSNLFLVDRRKKLQGIITAANAEKAVKEGKRLKDIVEKSDNYEVDPDTPLEDILPVMANLNLPAAVVDKNRKLLGTVVRGAIVGGLAESRKKQRADQND